MKDLMAMFMASVIGAGFFYVCLLAVQHPYGWGN